LKKLGLEIGDSTIAIAAADDSTFECRMIVPESNERSLQAKALPELLGPGHSELYENSDLVLLSLPMRYSLNRIVNIDKLGVERFGSDFIDWLAEQQLPSELGNFAKGFVKLKDSFDDRKSKNLFFALSAEIYESFKNLAAADEKKKTVIYPQAVALYGILKLARQDGGLSVVVYFENTGAAIVAARDNDFVAARFISYEVSDFADECMYYVMGHAIEGERPALLLGGDLSSGGRLGSLDWSDRIEVSRALHSIPPEFYTAAGLCLWGD